MIFSLRLGKESHSEPIFIDELIKTLGECGNCIDEVWLASSYGLLSVEQCKAEAEKMGETAEKIKNVVESELEKQNKTLNIIKVSNVEEAVKTAYSIAKQNEIVLFSPASTSFDMFKNFEERGKKFKEEVHKL